MSQPEAPSFPVTFWDSLSAHSGPRTGGRGCQQPERGRRRKLSWVKQGGGLGSNEVRGSRECSWINLELKIAPCCFCLRGDFLKVSAAPWRKPACVSLPLLPTGKLSKIAKTRGSKSSFLIFRVSLACSLQSPQKGLVYHLFSFLTGIITGKVFRGWKTEKKQKFQAFKKNLDSMVLWLSTWGHQVNKRVSTLNKTEALYGTEGSLNLWRMTTANQPRPCCT